MVSVATGRPSDAAAVPAVAPAKSPDADTAAPTDATLGLGVVADAAAKAGDAGRDAVGASDVCSSIELFAADTVERNAIEIGGTIDTVGAFGMYMSCFALSARLPIRHPRCWRCPSRRRKWWG